MPVNGGHHEHHAETSKVKQCHGFPLSRCFHLLTIFHSFHSAQQTTNNVALDQVLQFQPHSGKAPGRGFHLQSGLMA